MGVVFLEAMASKTPVIGTNTGGIPDIIKNEKTGLLIEQKSPDHIRHSFLRGRQVISVWRILS